MTVWNPPRNPRPHLHAFLHHQGSRKVGLGLTITRQVIKQHGETLEVDSTPGQGTTFTIRLPLASELVDADQPSSALEQAAESAEEPPSAAPQ